MSRIKIQIPRDKLEFLYLREFKSLPAIGRIYNCSWMTVQARLKEFNISLRSPSASHMRYRKFDFSEDLIEKAYLLGFRLGDLNAYTTNKNSELIVVRCNTTQDVQIELIEKIFSKYGRVTASIGKHSTNVNCFLNKTFDFLLPKYKIMPTWLKKSNDITASFIAGYTDAEGNFILNQRKARFKIDSYDKEILSFIFEWLKKNKINAKFRLIASKGLVREDGSKFNSDLWRLNINNALSLLNFIKILKPFIKHETRSKHMKICEENILERTVKGNIKYAI